MVIPRLFQKEFDKSSNLFNFDSAARVNCHRREMQHRPIALLLAYIPQLTYQIYQWFKAVFNLHTRKSRPHSLHF